MGADATLISQTGFVAHNIVIGDRTIFFSFLGAIRHQIDEIMDWYPSALFGFFPKGGHFPPLFWSACTWNQWPLHLGRDNRSFRVESPDQTCNFPPSIEETPLRCKGNSRPWYSPHRWWCKKKHCTWNKSGISRFVAIGQLIRKAEKRLASSRMEDFKLQNPPAAKPFSP